MVFIFLVTLFTPMNNLFSSINFIKFLENSEPNEHDSLVYEMKIKCTKKDLDALSHKQFISFPGNYYK